MTATDLAQALADVTPGDERFQSAFKTARVSNSRLARYYLRSLELAAQGVTSRQLV